MSFQDYKGYTSEQKDRLKRARELADVAEQIVKDIEKVTTRAEKLAEIAQALIADID